MSRGPNYPQRWVKALIKDISVSGVSLAVGRQVAEYGNFTNGTEVRPGVARLAKETHFSERTVQRALNDLTKRGWLELITRGRRGKNSLFRLTFKATESPVNEGRQPDGESSTNRTESQTTSSIPATPAPPRGAAGVLCPVCDEFGDEFVGFCPACKREVAA